MRSRAFAGVVLAVFILAASLHGAAAADFSLRFDALRAAASPTQLYALLYDLPKGGDLHNHSGGAERPEWIYAICTDPARNGGDTFYTRAHFSPDPAVVPLTERFRNLRQSGYDRLPPDVRKAYVRLDALTSTERAEWCDSLRLDRPGEGREEFFSVIWPRRGQLGSSLPVCTEALVECLKAFGGEHLAYLETQFEVESMVNNDGTPIPTDEAIAYVRRRLAQPDAAGTGIVVRFQNSVVRFLPNAEARVESAYAFVAAHRDLWVSVNLVGIEENKLGDPRRFLSTFRKLRAQYPTLPLSIHAGEMDGADSHIRDTLLLGATRIGHGVNLIKDPDTLVLLQRSRDVLVEINLISNRLLEYTPDLAKHPFPEYLRTGVPVCLNTDDRGMWDSNLTDEYYTAVTTFNLSWSEIVQLGSASLAHAYVQSDVKAWLLAEYETRVATFERKYGAGETGTASVADALAKLATVRPVTYGYAKRTWGLAFAPAVR
jgi:adenosine deaminase CECR1